MAWSRRGERLRPGADLPRSSPSGSGSRKQDGHPPSSAPTAALDGLRRQGRAIIEAVGRHDGFVSAQRLHAEMRLDGSTVGISTIYKTLNAVAARGYLDMVTDPREGALFRLRENPGRDHYLRCRDCGRAETIPQLDLDGHLRQALDGLPFRDVTYTLDVSGRCRTCDDDRL